MAALLDYEEGRTAETRWMRETDEFECLIQAHEYEQRTQNNFNINDLRGLILALEGGRPRLYPST